MKLYLSKKSSYFESTLKKFVRVMNIILFILTFSLFQAYASRSLAQKVTIDKQNISLSIVFDEIRNQTGYDFFYNSEHLKKAQLITIKVNEASVEDVLNRSFENQPFSYTINDKVVVVTQKEILANSSVGAFQASVAGKVIDSDRNGLPGVTVSVKGTTTAVSTREDGSFTIGADGNSTLMIRMIGFKSQELGVQGRKVINITLEEDMSVLQEVEVISTGYQNLDRKLFTGSASTLKASDVERNGVPDISRMLEGQVAGASVQNVSGTFGSAPKIRIRGATSLSGDNKPLWVIDGIILEDVVNISNEALSTGDANTLIGSSVAGLNPSDIESFNILKDAAATALYGARAANGVVVIETKKGKAGKAEVTFSSTNGLNKIKKTIDVMNPY